MAIAAAASSVRLTGGDGTSGRVEVKVESVWGTACGDGFGADEAQAVCRSIGLDYDASYHDDHSVGQRYNWRTSAAGPPMPVVMGQANCNGTGGAQPGSILDCDFTANPTNCSPSENVQVITEVESVF